MQSTEAPVEAVAPPAPDTPSRHAIEVPSVGRRVVGLFIALVAIVHSIFIFVWVTPTNPIREAIGSDLVKGYINNDYVPFEQSWSVFAPTPRRGGENVQVRAYIGELGTDNGTFTEWFDITADEDQRIKYLVNPARIHSATRRLGGNINSTVAKFNSTQTALIARQVTESPRSELNDLLLRANRSGVVGEENVRQYMLNDEMLTRFGTMYATARWGEGVSMVQFRVGHRSVPNYSKRKDLDFLDVPFTYYNIGWRKAIPGNKDAQAAFDGYVERAPATAPKDGEQ